MKEIKGMTDSELVEAIKLEVMEYKSIFNDSYSMGSDNYHKFDPLKNVDDMMEVMNSFQGEWEAGSGSIFNYAIVRNRRSLHASFIRAFLEAALMAKRGEK